ncbi:hypothetical protein GQ600_712 [Phytophthora cactorum]|nr:hypothetical protein GQ600_712 [Phytophthora cactorum]
MSWNVHARDGRGVGLASGYLLGEILHRLNHQHNFADFMRSSSADAKGPNHGRTEEARGLFGEDGGAERDPGGYEGGRLHRAYIHSSFIKEALEETESTAWRLALQKKSAREQRRTAFFQQLMNREEAEVRMPQKEYAALV